jgi:hypothetical protein
VRRGLVAAIAVAADAELTEGDAPMTALVVVARPRGRSPGSPGQG